MRAVLVALLLLPLASAELAWTAPSEAIAGHPVPLGYTIYDGDTLLGHQDVTLRAYLDDVLFLETDDVHEHDGVHTLILTAPAAGELVVEAVWEDETVRAPLTIVPATPHNQTMDQRFDWDGATGFPYSLGMQGDALPGSGYIDALASDGTQLVSAFLSWERDGAGIDYWHDYLQEDNYWASRTSHPTANPHQGMGLWEGGAFALPGTLPYLDGPPTAPCSDQLTLDPISLTDGISTFQIGSSVRVAMLGEPEKVRVGTHLVYSDGEIPPKYRYGVSSAETFGAFTFRPPVAGPAWIAYGDECVLPLMFVPAPVSTGSIEAEIVVENSNASIRMGALDGDFDPIGHYEFEYRVMRLDDPGLGRLVYAGKLHGHDGDAELRLMNLEAGNYTVQVFPTPQSQDAPRVVAASSTGWKYDFSVNQGADWGDEPEEAASTATPGPFALLPLLGALLLRRR